MQCCGETPPTPPPDVFSNIRFLHLLEVPELNRYRHSEGQTDGRTLLKSLLIYKIITLSILLARDLRIPWDCRILIEIYTTNVGIFSRVNSSCPAVSVKLKIGGFKTTKSGVASWNFCRIDCSCPVYPTPCNVHALTFQSLAKPALANIKLLH